MLAANNSSLQRLSQELHADRDDTHSFYAASTFPLTVSNSTSNDTKKWMTGPVTTMYIVCFSAAALAITLNAVVLAALLRYARKLRPYTILVMNLCAADCVLSFTTIFLYTMQYIRLHSMDNGTPWGMLATIYCCQFVFEEIAWTVAFYGSMLTIVTMSSYHFIAHRWPHSKICLESKQGIVVALFLVWSLALGLGLLQCFIVATSYHHAMELCPHDLSKFCCQLSIYKASRYLMNQETHKKVLYSVFAGVIIYGFFVIICVYSYLITKSWITRRLKMATHKSHELPTAAELAWRRLMATTAMLVAAFCVFWLPYAVFLCLHGFRLMPNLIGELGKEKLHMLKVALHTLGCLSGITDPFIYCLRVPEVRDCMQKTPGIRHMLFTSKTSTKTGEVARKS